MACQTASTHDGGLVSTKKLRIPFRPWIPGVVLATWVFSFPVHAEAQVLEVDPRIGGVGVLLAPTRPTVHLPNGMIRVYPIRKDGLDDQIRSFPLTIISHRLGELFWLMPHSGAITDRSWGDAKTCDNEQFSPNSYSATLDESQIQVAFAPGERSGYFDFHFPDSTPILLLANRFTGEMTPIGDNAVSGVERFNDMQAFLYGEFSTPVAFTRTENGGKPRIIARALHRTNKLAFRYGISFISIDQARINLHSEIASQTFDKLKQSALKRWNQTLGQIEIEGGTPSQRRVFYTSLYRTYERMVNISEQGRYYSAFDHQVHDDPRPFYTDNWIWDTYRALEPLHTLLNPSMEADKIQSYVRMYEQSGWMPSFAVLWGDHACMTGNHAAAWIADAWWKGVRNFDLPKAYEGLRKNSLEATLLPWRNGPRTVLDDFHNTHGFFPALHPGEKETVPEVSSFERRQSLSVTLGSSYDDWCLAQLADSSGHLSDRELFLKRSANYKNLFRVEKSAVWPKDQKGKWIEPFNPKFSGGLGGRDYTTENNGYTYDWDVQHDLSGLFELMGGRAKAESKLDQLFREGLDRSRYEFLATFPDSTGMIGQFSMGNEPGFHIPYLYVYLGAPWKTQKRIRMILDTLFTDTLSGIPGDEDGGAASAFAVFSMMGFYPVTPGVPIYTLGSPVFNRVTIHLRNGKTIRITAKGNSRQNKYIQSVRLNGKPLSQLWFRHTDIVDGGTIELQMGHTPNRTLGTSQETLPSSAIQLNPGGL
jgi:predicted alpha-1,2-mannosidase